MCGIVGLHTLEPGRAVSLSQLRTMNDRIRHRGPDDSGEKLFGAFGMGMRRLSIIDLASGHQPLSNEDGSIWVVFNGEIYNHPELRDELAKAGHTFRTRSDTEVLVHAYEEYGDDFAARLNGMFAFALWDNRRRRLLLGRDRVGIKPLYYYLDGKRLAFASEVKALLSLDEIPRELDLEALDEFFTLEYVLAPKTLLKNVRKLLPGHLLILENGRLREKKYWFPSLLPAPLSEEEFGEALRRELRQAVARHMLSDVPLGAFLSGGIDSSILVGLMAEQHNRPVKTFSIGFEDSSYNECAYARLVSRRFGTDHHEFMLRPDPVTFLDDFTRFLDEPIGDVSILPTFLVSQKARRHVKVALAGDGGDELFGGYDTYLAEGFGTIYGRAVPPVGQRLLARWAAGLRPSPRKKGLVNRVKRFIDGTRYPAAIHQYRWMAFLTDEERTRLYSQSFQEALLPGNAFRRLLDIFSEARHVPDPLNRMLYADLKIYLPEDILAKVDVASMANSLEVRVPYLDARVVELALSMPGRLKIRDFDRKFILKRTFQDMLPPEILRRGKEGFSIPLKNWLKRELKTEVTDVLNIQSVNQLGLHHWPAVSRLIADHRSGVQNHAHQLWCLMVFYLWHRKFVGGSRGTLPAAVAPAAPVMEPSPVPLAG